MIVPSARFNCKGRISSIAVSQFQSLVPGSNFPLFQVWRPTLPNSTTYNKVVEFILSLGTLRVDGAGRNYYHMNASLDTQTEFQSGDVIGYYQPSDPRRSIWSIQTSGYTSYSNSITSPSTSIDISNVDNIDTDRQPLIAVMFGKLHGHLKFIC